MAREDAEIARNVNRCVDHIRRSHRNTEFYLAHFFAWLLRLRVRASYLQREDENAERRRACQLQGCPDCFEALLFHLLPPHFSFPVRVMCPGGNAALDQPQQARQSYAKDTQRDHRNKHGIRAVNARIARDKVTDAGDRCVQIGKHHADQTTANGQSEASDDKWQRRGQDDVGPKLALAATKSTSDFEQTCVDVFDSLIGIDDHWEESEKKNDGDFG